MIRRLSFCIATNMAGVSRMCRVPVGRCQLPQVDCVEAGLISEHWKPIALWGQVSHDPS
mgnify:CR=1 FL=1